MSSECFPLIKKVFIEIKNGIKAIGPIGRLLKQDIVSSALIVMMEFDLNMVTTLRKIYPSIEILWLYGFSKAVPSETIRLKLQEVLDISVSHQFDGVNIQNIP